MTPDGALNVERKIVDDWETDIIAQLIDLTEAIAAAKHRYQKWKGKP